MHDFKEQQGTSMSSLGASKDDRGEILVDSFGRIARNQGQYSLPLLGSASAIGIETLSTDGRAQWMTRQTVILTRSQREKPRL